MNLNDVAEVVKRYCILPKNGKKKNIFVISSPGLGKSMRMAQLAQELNTGFVPLYPIFSEPTEMKGTLWCYADDKGLPHSHYIAPPDAEELINTTRPTLCLIDDIGNVPQATQSAYLHVVHARRIGPYTISPHVGFVLCSNLISDKANVRGVVTALKSRTIIVKVDPDVDTSIIYFRKIGMPDDLVWYLQYRPQMLFHFVPSYDFTNDACPRTLETVGDLINEGMPDHLEMELLEGAAGKPFAQDFFQFRQIKKDLPKLAQIVIDPDNVDVPSDMMRLYCLCSAISSIADRKNFDNIIRYAKRMPSQFLTLLLYDVTTKKPEMKKTSAFINWATSSPEEAKAFIN